MIVQVSFTDTDSPYYCKRNVFIVCFVLSVTMIVAGIISVFIFLWLRIVDTRRQNRNR